MWDAKGNWTKNQNKESRDINLALDNIKAHIIKHNKRISDEEAFVIAKMVRNTYLGNGMEYETLLGAVDGRYKIDTNMVKNGQSPVALSRKNYLLCKNHDAAEDAAVMYTMMGYRKVAEINVEEC